MVDGPLVSVIIPSYNSAQYLKEAIESCLDQTYENIEIIVIDDGSTDDTAILVKHYGNNITYVYQKNSGLASARNTGIKRAKGDYVQFLDADDIILKEKIEFQVNYLEEHKDNDVVYCDVRYFENNDKKELIDLQLQHHTGHILGKLLLENFIPLNVLLFSRKCIEKIGVFKGDGSYLYGVEDWEYLIRIAYNGFLFGYIDEVLALCRKHSDSMSANILRMKKGGLDVMKEVRKFITDEEQKRQLNLNKYFRWRYSDYGDCLLKERKYCKGFLYKIKSYFYF
ncbi:glycosyltransferase [Chlamydiota bacterium]